MPIILAIEPDRRQRDALSAVVRQRVGAELILADTTERALEAIGNRVPDLVLVPALLSPTDDAALAAALRVIAAAAHVRTLTIPVLASHTQEAPSSGLLSRWRRGRSAPQAPDGCDPAVFAEQIVAYLKEGAAERAQRLDDEEHGRSFRQEVGEAESQPSEFTQEFGLEDFQSTESDVEPDTQTYVQPAAETYVPADPQMYLQDPVEEYPVAASLEQYPVAADLQQDPIAAGLDQYPVAAGLEQYPQDASNTAADHQPDVPVYVQPDVQGYAQSDVDTDALPGPQTPLQDPVETVLEHYAVTYNQPDEQPQAEMPNEGPGLIEGDEYDSVYAGSDELSTLQLEQQEDIDLSSELDELETEEPGGMRAGASETELFDGEPVAVYTMPSVIDELEIEVAVLEARRPFAEAEAEIEPALTVDAIAESESEVEAAVDPEFFAEAFAESTYETEPTTERELDTEASVDAEFYAEQFTEPALDEEPRTEPEAEAAVARAFEAETTLDAAEYDDINAEDAEPEPADAEPWASAFLSPRWMWPAIEGVPTEQPSAFVAVEAVAAPPAPAVAERPAPVPHKRPEWSELVASLRKDIERRRVEPPQEKPKAAAPATAAAAAVQPPRRSKKSKPIQDEWGFFDPEQCGFAALLAKLDEITESADDVPVQQSSVHQSS